MAHGGWCLALADVNEAGLAETLQLVRAAGGEDFTRRCDVRDYSQLTAQAQACEEKFGGIEVIVKIASMAALMQGPAMSNYCSQGRCGGVVGLPICWVTAQLNRAPLDSLCSCT